MAFLVLHRRLETNSVSIIDFATEHHEGAKQRPSIIFIHSDAGNKEQFNSAFHRLKSLDYGVVRFDRRGHGHSSVPQDGKFGYNVESGDIFDVADAAGVDRFVLIGHSGGGAVAFKAANEQEGRVIGLLLVDPAPDPAVIPAEQKAATREGLQNDYKAFLNQYFRSIAGPDAKIAEQIVGTALATPSETMIGINEHLDEFKPRAYAGQFKGLAHAVLQPQFDVDGALHRLQTGMTHETIANAGHWIHMVAPMKFEAALDRFLDRLK
jgi:pimeloyl-ACP methyl ester carboxylesterase